MVDVPADMEIRVDGALSPRTAIEPLGELTVSTHGRRHLMIGSVAVMAEGPIGSVAAWWVRWPHKSEVTEDFFVAESRKPAYPERFPQRRQQTLDRHQRLAFRRDELCVTAVDAGLPLRVVPPSKLDPGPFAVHSKG